LKVENILTIKLQNENLRKFKKKGGVINRPFTISKKYIEADQRKLADWQIAKGAEEHIKLI